MANDTTAAPMNNKHGQRDKHLNVEYIGAAKCDVCAMERADVAEFRAGWITWARICDSCCSRILHGYSPERGGAA